MEDDKLSLNTNRWVTVYAINPFKPKNILNSLANKCLHFGFCLVDLREDNFDAIFEELSKVLHTQCVKLSLGTSD